MLRFAMLCLALPLGLLPSLASGCSERGRVRYEQRTFLGYACEHDCERHKTGFRWAEQHAVTDSRQCAPLPRPEAEGCAAFVEEGRDAAAAGDRWAIENEIARPCDCRGAGQRFRMGCTQALTVPAARGPRRIRLRRSVAGASRAVSLPGHRPVKCRR